MPDKKPIQPKKPSDEQARQDLLDRLENTVAVNPAYEGKTVKEVVRGVLGSRLRRVR